MWTRRERTARLIHVKTANALTGSVFESHRKRIKGVLRKSSASVAEDNQRKRPRQLCFFLPSWFSPMRYYFAIFFTTV